MGRVRAGRDIVIPVRQMDYNLGLALTLRSIEMNFPHKRVWIAGHKPPWVSDSVGYIHVPQMGGNWQNVLMILNEVVVSDEVDEDFWYFNDDFYVMRKMRNPPTFQQGTLAEKCKRMRGVSINSYVTGAETTLKLLQDAGFEDPINFDLHAPMPMNKTGLDDAIGFILRSGKVFWPHLRSVFGALTGLVGVEGKDAKVGGVMESIPEGADFVSSSPRSLQGQLGRELKLRFPDPSSYEKNIRR